MKITKQSLISSGFKEDELGFENESFAKLIFDNYLQDKLSLPSFCIDFNIQKNNFLKELASYLNLGFEELEKIEIDKSISLSLDFNFLQENELLPFKQDENSIFILVLKPLKQSIYESLEHLFRNKFIKFFLGDKAFLKIALNDIFIYQNIARLSAKLKAQWAQSLKQEQTSISEIFTFISDFGVQIKASDIHIEARANDSLVRMRVDGLLRVFCELESKIARALVSYIKILAHLNITQERNAQDGSFTMNCAGHEFDFRVSTLPLEYGESVVLRLLVRDFSPSIDELKLDSRGLNLLKKSLAKPHGMILLTGPTGSGKSTTLHACLNALKSPAKKIITAEDPIEYKIDGVAQIMLNEKAGLDFTNALRAILRQDPDIIMVGEIRDEESLDIAIKASLTGHLLLSTLHTNDALSAIYRLVNMRAKPYLIASSLSLIIAQRLVRKLCPHCKIKSNKKSEFEGEFYESLGCEKCGHTGFAGRELVSEFVYIDEKMAQLIRQNADKTELLSHLKTRGFESIFQNALNKARDGIISLDELFRCVSVDDL